MTIYLIVAINYCSALKTFFSRYIYQHQLMAFFNTSTLIKTQKMKNGH